MRKPIKVKLIKVTILGEVAYMVAEISGATTLGGYNGKVFRAGDTLNEKEAEALSNSYLVTVRYK
jgi:hypothetical protein